MERSSNSLLNLQNTLPLFWYAASRFASPLAMLYLDKSAACMLGEQRWSPQKLLLAIMAWSTTRCTWRLMFTCTRHRRPPCQKPGIYPLCKNHHIVDDLVAVRLSAPQ